MGVEDRREGVDRDEGKGQQTSLPYDNLIAYQVAAQLLVNVRDARIRDAHLRDRSSPCAPYSASSSSSTAFAPAVLFAAIRAFSAAAAASSSAGRGSIV